MKTYKLTFFAFLTIISLFFVSCNNDDDASPSADGAPFEAAIYEVEADLVLTDSLYYEYKDAYPSAIKAVFLEDDKLLVYRLEEITSGGSDVWRQLPQPYFSDQGLLFYNFEYTKDSLALLLEPEFDATIVPSNLVEKQVFRIVVVPTNFGNTTSKMNLSDINSVMQDLSISENDIQKH